MSQVSNKNFVEAAKSKEVVILDVRNKDEFAIESIPGSKNVPLHEIEKGADVGIAKDQLCYVICRSGVRSKSATKILKDKGYNVLSVEGGITQCAKESNLVEKKAKGISIMRQVQMAAGLLILTGIILSHFIHPSFIYLSALVGAGLTFAGVTGFCALGILLEKMPWNKALTCGSSK